MIKAFVTINADGYIINNSILGLSPRSIIDDDKFCDLLADTLIMATMDMVPKQIPSHLAAITRKSLLAETVHALCTMASNLMDKEIGDISILANEEIIETLDEISASYDLMVVYPMSLNSDDLPEWLVDGRKHANSVMCDKYIVDIYQQSVIEASDTQIADYINGIESYMNIVDNMDVRDKNAVDKIARGVQLLNKAIQRDNEMNSKLFDSGDNDYNDEDQDDISVEFDHIWDTLQMAADQISDVSRLTLETQETLTNFVDYAKNNLNVKSLTNKMSMMSDEIDQLRHQLGLHIEESYANSVKKTSKSTILWYVIGIIGIIAVNTVINLLL